MSMYNVISNSYNDLLNTLDNENRSNTGGLKSMFENISDDKKRSFVIKLADTMLLFDTAFNSEITYWDGVRKENLIFLVGYSVMTGIIGIIVIFIAGVFIVMQWHKDKDMFSIVKILIRFVLVLHVILSVMIILIKNSTISLKYANGQKLLIENDSQSYSNYLFRGASKDDMAKLFLFIGYYRRRSIGKYRRLHTELQRNRSFDEVLALYSVNAETATERAAKEPLNTSVEVQVYNLLRFDIQNSLTVFYNDGNGYVDAKKKIMLSSPVMMLKEVQNDMNYYVSYGQKKDISVMSSTIESSEKKMINDMITKPILDLIKDIPDNVEPKETEINAAVSLNESNNRFRNHYAKLVSTFYLTALFIYPLSVGVMPEDPSFTPKSIVENMPYNIVPSKMEEEELKHYEYVRNFFYNLKSGRDYERFVKSGPNEETMIKMCEKVRPLFSDLYYKVFYYMEGNVKYPLIKSFMINEMVNYYRISPANALSQDYLMKISNIMFDSIIKPVGASLNIIKIRQNILIDKLSKSLADTSIDFSRYQNEVIVTVSQSSPRAKGYIDDVKKLLEEVQQRTVIERQIKVSTDVSHKYKYNTIENFTKLIDNTSYDSFVDGFKIDYFKDIIDKFYMNISESVMLKKPNQRNIYYYRQQSFKLFKSGITMLIIALVILYVIYAIYIFNDFFSIKKQETTSECDSIYAWREFRNKLANWAIKLIFPILILIIGVALLVSVYKKAASKFEFNLEIIESNTNGLKSLLDDYAIILEELKKKMEVGESTKSIGSITTVTADDKKMILEHLIKIIDKYEKCNYIVEAGNKAVPFPYTEIVMYGFLTLVGVGCALYVILIFKPVTMIVNIKKLNKLKDQVYMTNNLSGLNEKINSFLTCHKEDSDAVILSMKMLFIVLITVFMLFYSVKIVGESNDFKKGLYNSSYFNDSKCYGT